MEVAIFEKDEARKKRDDLAEAGRRVVFTNGCFDLLHRGHLHLLREARKQGDYLIVGLNTDASVRRIKGESRPVKSETDRARVLDALEMVDAVVLFDEDTPRDLIETLTPDVLVKGSDYEPDDVVGADHVQNNGGELYLVDLLPDHSTTAFIETIRKGERSQ